MPKVQRGRAQAVTEAEGKDRTGKIIKIFSGIKRKSSLAALNGGALFFQRKYVIIFPIARKSMERPAAYPAGYAAAFHRENGYIWKRLIVRICWN